MQTLFSREIGTDVRREFDMRRIRPRRGNCLVELLPPDDKTYSGLFLPDIAHDRIKGEKEKPFKGLVVEMGNSAVTVARSCPISESAPSSFAPLTRVRNLGA